MAFTHLHVHTEYSLLDGSNKIREYVRRVKELGMDSAAITDHGVMYGVVDFYKAAKAAGIRPILGCEVYVAPGSRLEKDTSGKEGRYYHLVLLAENNTGYENLVKIVSRGFTEGYYYKPRVDMELLETYHEGIIALSACLAGEVSRNALRGQIEEAKQAALKYEACFGKGNFFLEIQDHGLPEQRNVNAVLMQLSRELEIPLVATNDVHYTYAEDEKSHDILLCVQTGKKLADEDRMRYEGGQYYVKSEEEMRSLFPYASEAVENSARIAQRCQVEIEFGVTRLPHFDVPEGYDSWGYLQKLCREGLEQRYGVSADRSGEAGTNTSGEKGSEANVLETNASDTNASGEKGSEAAVLETNVSEANTAETNASETNASDTNASEANISEENTSETADWKANTPASDHSGQALKERLEYELNVIRSMGYVDYFLIVWDFINYARQNDIMVGPGRGSAAGSLVAYCLRITDIDPVKYGLLFERFLNPERVSMPDIDIDFCFERRQEVIDYVGAKYGPEKVVQIITFGTMAAKGVIRDVGRVMDLPYAYVDSIAKMIPNELNITIDRALEINPEFRKLYEQEEQVKTLIDMSRRLEGLPRHSSIHAAGVVICSRPAEEFVPLSRGSDGSITTQFTMTTIEELGLLKMDFLGLRTLTVIQNAKRLAEKNRGVRIDLEHLDYEDEEVLASIGTGRTDGIFQLESGGMKNFMKELKPKSLEDIIAGISLYRPGPMDFIPKYIKGKNDEHEITYTCPELESILAPTYGCIVYQEQVMQIVRDLGGYTLGRSDLVRRAMSKKKQSVMEKERDNFIYGNPEEGVPGCVSRGIDAQVAGRIYAEMMDFAKYAFNKSHAACYAVVSYQTAYLKYYYPVEFMAALLTSVMDFPVKISGYIMACRSMGIAILPPDINEGEAGFSAAGSAIRYALTAIKGVGRPLIEAIVRERERGGAFRSLKDFIERGHELGMNKRAVENFIKAGALDGLGGTRKQFSSVYIRMMDQIQQERKHHMAGQMSLFDIASEEAKESFDIRLPDVGEYPKEIRLGMEKEVLGIYVSGHPLEEYEEVWRKNITHTTSAFLRDEETGEAALNDGEIVTIGGLISEKKNKYTKNDKVMAFLQVEDLAGTVEVIVFPKDYEKNADLLTEDGKVFIRGRAALEEERDGKLICEHIMGFDEVRRKLWIKFPSKETYLEAEEELMKILKDFSGRDSVCIYVEQPKAIRNLPPALGVKADKELTERLGILYGEDNIKITG